MTGISAMYSRVYTVFFEDRPVLARQLVIKCAACEFQYFLLRRSFSTIILGKEMGSGGIIWLGNNIGEPAAKMGDAIEAQTGMLLAVNPCAFSQMAGAYTRYYIDSIAVDRVTVTLTDITISYYLFRVESDLIYRLACFQFAPLWRELWYPLMPLEPAEVYHISDMIREYECGDYDAYRQIIEGLLKCLQKASGK